MGYQVRLIQGTCTQTFLWLCINNTHITILHNHYMLKKQKPRYLTANWGECIPSKLERIQFHTTHLHIWPNNNAITSPDFKPWTQPYWKNNKIRPDNDPIVPELAWPFQSESYEIYLLTFQKVISMRYIIDWVYLNQFQHMVLTSSPR